MAPLFILLLVPGVVGGLVLALLIARRGERTPPVFVPRRLAAPSPALINMAHIPIEGVGGLGMVAAVLVVAVSDPRIGLATMLAAVLGAGLALLLIAMRRRTGPLPSKGDGGIHGRSAAGIRAEADRRAETGYGFRLTGVRQNS